MNHKHFMSERLNTEIASDISPTFLSHCFIWALKKKKERKKEKLNRALQGGEKKYPKCLSLLFFVCVSFMPDEQWAAQMMASVEGSW